MSRKFDAEEYNVRNLRRAPEDDLAEESYDIDDTLETVRGYARTANEFIRRRPVAVLLGAVAFGAIAALISAAIDSGRDVEL